MKQLCSIKTLFMSIVIHASILLVIFCSCDAKEALFRTAKGKSRSSTQWLGYNRLWRHTTRSPEKNRPWWLTTRWQGYYNTWRLTTRWQGYYSTRWHTKPWQGYYGPIQRDSQTASGHFAVVFLVAVPLVFGICFLCRKRQRIADAINACSRGRKSHDDYRRLDTGTEELGEVNSTSGSTTGGKKWIL